MLTLFRGGGMLWISREDAEVLGIRDNDWVEVYNRNGVLACRAAVSHRIPEGTSAVPTSSTDAATRPPADEIRGPLATLQRSVTMTSYKETNI